ncbi:MAG: AAA family ATPase, partial [Deltaproteobacteria bacterium]|nr:AAA family ATPase [Deltaproteobacteria bacterium]
MEHLSTFQLSRDPFSNESQPAFYYESPAHQDAERRLMRASFQGKGLSLVTGEGGVGKTVLVRHFLDALEEEVFEACMLVPIPGVTDGQWILDRFARQLGVEEPAEDRQILMAQIYEQLAIVREDGRQTVLIFDEAQVLAEQGLLGELRGLLNLEYEDRRMLCLVLVGLPSLDAAIAAEPALRDRIDQRIELKPLDANFAVQYLSHRILTAGGNPAILDASAVQALVKASKGIPRYLNTLADNALFEAHVAGRVSASAGDVEQAAAELRPWVEEEEEGEQPPVPLAPARVSPAPREAAAPAAIVQPAQAARTPETVEAPSFEMAEVIASETEPPVAATPSASGEEEALWLDDSPSALQPAAPTSPPKPISGMEQLLGEEPPAR